LNNQNSLKIKRRILNPSLPMHKASLSNHKGKEM